LHHQFHLLREIAHSLLKRRSRCLRNPWGN
jgi:hypothetical protein